jgi:hypothetical protein
MSDFLNGKRERGALFFVTSSSYSQDARSCRASEAPAVLSRMQRNLTVGPPIRARIDRMSRLQGTSKQTGSKYTQVKTCSG